MLQLGSRSLSDCSLSLCSRFSALNRTYTGTHCHTRQHWRSDVCGLLPRYVHITLLPCTNNSSPHQPRPINYANLRQLTEDMRRQISQETVSTVVGDSSLREVCRKHLCTVGDQGEPGELCQACESLHRHVWARPCITRPRRLEHTRGGRKDQATVRRPQGDSGQSLHCPTYPSLHRRTKINSRA